MTFESHFEYENVDKTPKQCLYPVNRSMILGKMALSIQERRKDKAWDRLKTGTGRNAVWERSDSEKRKNPETNRFKVFRAGAEGLEPSTKVLGTHVLPLHHTPESKDLRSIAFHSYYVNTLYFLFFTRKITIFSENINIFLQLLFFHAY